MSSPDDAGSPQTGARPRRPPPPRRDKRGASVESRDEPGACGTSRYWSAGGDGSPSLSGSRGSLSSNRDSGYVPSPAGAVRFDLDTADPPDHPPPSPATSTPPRRATAPISIPNLPPPGEGSGLLLRRRRRRRSEDRSEDSEEDAGAREDGQGDAEDGVFPAPDGRGESSVACAGYSPGGGQTAEGRDEVDQTQTEVALLYREARSLRVGWREEAVIPPGLTFRADLPDLPELSPRRRAASASGGRPRSRASSASLAVELDVGQELREIADALPLSRSAPGALLARRDIWTLIRRTFDFGMGRQAAPRPRRASGRQ